MIDMAQADSSLRKDGRKTGNYMVLDFDGQVIARDLSWAEGYEIVADDMINGLGAYHMVRTGDKDGY